MATTHFSGPVNSANGFQGNVTGDVTGTVTGLVVVPTYTVATLPDAVEGGIIRVSDGAAGSDILAFSDGTDWLRSDTGAAVSDS
jgi:hypothetical protein